VEYTEFVAGCLNFFDDSLDEMLWHAFTKFDVDGNGTLSCDEVAQLLSKVGRMRMKYNFIRFRKK
jgi:Ca2+-binding EF-hand superfamily protein